MADFVGFNLQLPIIPELSLVVTQPARLPTSSVCHLHLTKWLVRWQGLQFGRELVVSRLVDFAIATFNHVGCATSGSAAR